MSSGSLFKTTPVQIAPDKALLPALYTISPNDGSGWLMVKLQDNSLVYLPEYTKIEFLKVENNRTFFLIKDGIYANKIASLKKENYDKYISLTTRGKGAEIRVKVIGRKVEYSNFAGIELNQLWAILSFGDTKIRITLDSDVDYKETDKNNPNYGKIRHSERLPAGRYKIMTPNYPKDKRSTAIYRD